LILPFLPQGWFHKERIEDKRIGNKIIPSLRRYYWNSKLKLSIRHHPASADGEDEIQAGLANQQ
jgi:hypothetical protein